MHVKDILDYFGIRVKLPQHWYSTDVSNEFEDAELLQNDEIIKIDMRNIDSLNVSVAAGILMHYFK